MTLIRWFLKDRKARKHPWLWETNPTRRTLKSWKNADFVLKMETWKQRRERIKRLHRRGLQCRGQRASLIFEVDNSAEPFYWFHGWELRRLIPLVCALYLCSQELLSIIQIQKVQVCLCCGIRFVTVHHSFLTVFKNCNHSVYGILQDSLRVFSVYHMY